MSRWSPALWAITIVFAIIAIQAFQARIASYTTKGVQSAIKDHAFREQAFSTMTAANTSKVGDVYFLSHGGPPTIEQYDSAPYEGWRKFGKILKANPPKGIVVVSAHWEAEGAFRSGVIVNNNSANPLIYDFYGFPKHFYELKFRSRAEPELQDKVVKALKEGGITVSRANRGLDHGVWVPFRAAFGDETNFPLVQVSLPASSNPRESVEVGKALASLRQEGYAIMGTGQVVHNLRDLFTGGSLSYTSPFLGAVSIAVSESDPVASTLKLTGHPLYRRAHPTDEHFFPLLVASGAVQPGDKVEEIYKGVVDIGGKTVKNDGLGWGMWRWTAA
ncbi:extradiol ring-cleavage dioxygenase [Cryptococcus gattii Ru294]|nr:extradiol ring-cleavage dioxygenase [Cryptococcus gattii Ru294]